MLSQKIINKILETGFYFDDEFDFEKNKIVLTQESREWFRDNLGLKYLNSAFVDFYSFCSGGCGPNDNADCLYGLEEICEDYKQSFHADDYPNITDRYLQISSIEGEGSYFYDKKTDAVYDVDWGDMDDFMAGRLKPIFTSFYDFLEWYYSEED
ncbi:hypothetical protein [bacterium endosymbiont of Bathymodiolus sp. 5 South]|jgi:hypothetical protein|uniref:hypothetical protein n=1 Tax=bacterium endosymbiont of Bathymodiolus sp. 5 South TaxID=1181670 RepID=UPI0010BC7D3C|nr:hypothetical protein [bacterium endosymbiont of Bathymodiolus sp. 5 South]SSC08997.1 hypothetical protein BTURTLESOX_2143 [bacterium endosymbiont of Bathymodiolus sp. 5 South]VVH61793.1 hypothetical protein BSPWISOX_1998 [uncultured Gammaproteobacteria bacterium]VVM18791.1 hypothetical protein BSPWISOXPB_10033 [uncultured Gammaproteobacteria bacterium]